MFGPDRPHRRVTGNRFFAGMFGLAIMLQILARYVPGFAEGYARYVYPVILRGLGGISNLVPFALDEALIYILILLIVGYLAAGIRHMMKMQETVKEWSVKTIQRLIKAGILWFFLFTVNCGVNYHRATFSELAEIPVELSTVEELEGLCLWLTEKIEKTAPRIRTEENGLCAMPDQMREKTRQAMTELGNTYPQLAGWYPKAKPVFTWRVLSMEALEGVSGPYTMEANYNPDIPAHNQPAVLCHELSHLKGFMREDEANYIAYLACTGSEDANLKYSGLLLAYTHSINALYRADRERFSDVRKRLCEQAERDYAYHREYWKQFEGPVAKVSDKVNNAYLKANAQKEGSRSYGRMVDLLLGEYRRRED